MHHLSECQNVLPILAHIPIYNPPFNVELSNDQTAHAQNFKNQLLTNE